jgi:hypothetical protein
MIERLIKLKKYIKLALADLGKSDLYSEEMFIVFEDILKILKPTELAVKELNKDEATLLTRGGVSLFLFKKLKEQNTDLSNKLLDVRKGLLKDATKTWCHYCIIIFVIKMIQFFEFEMKNYIILFSLLQVVVLHLQKVYNI